MDVNQYLQCLEYISKQAAASKTWYEQFQPLINILGGVIIGFILNKASDYFKTKKDRKMQIKVIREEVSRTKELFSGVYKEAIRLADLSYAKQEADAWAFPSKIKLACISEFFVSLSYKFTEAERVAIFHLISSTETLNDFLSEFMKGETQPKDHKELGNMAMNLANTSTVCYQLCTDFQGNSINSSPILSTALADVLGLNESPLIQAIKKQAEDHKNRSTV